MSAPDARILMFQLCKNRIRLRVFIDHAGFIYQSLCNIQRVYLSLSPLGESSCLRFVENVIETR